MTARAAQDWPLSKLLALAAATFAILFGSLMPAVVAASPATGAPMMLCSGDMIVVSVDDQGNPVPGDDSGLASLACSGALLSSLAAVAPPTHFAAPTPITERAPLQERAAAAVVVDRPAPRPPSHGPPLA